MSSTYQHTAFLNLPVTDLQKSIAFYAALGLVQNKTFSDESAAQMSLAPRPGTTGPEAHHGAFKIMLLCHPFYDSFLPKGIERTDPAKVSHSILCLSRDSKAAVDETGELAAANGGKKDVREVTDMEKAMMEQGMYGCV